MWGKLIVCSLAIFVFVCIGGFAASAGTTGALSGAVILDDGSPLVGAKVTAAAPADTVSTTTDSKGHFAFVSLPPDTYTLTVSAEGYDPVSQAGISVFSDNTQTVTLQTRRTVKTIGHVLTRAAATALVKPGTTADVYSVNAAMQSKVTALGGMGGFDSAYSAIASVPGVIVYPVQSGWFQTIRIRGGDYDQVGYEFDGVPVLRSYDNYPSTNASALGQQELQVYTGAAPPNSESQGLSGYINQVIKTGTYPGTVTGTYGIGSPTLYNKGNLEAGGATPNRSFSYFIGIGGYDQGFRYINNSNGADVSALWGAPLATAPCPATGTPTDWNFTSCYASGVGPGGYILGPIQNVNFNANPAHGTDRENVFNFHFGIPHHNDTGHDDIQLLYDVSWLQNYWAGNAQDWGLPLVKSVFGNPYFQYTNALFYTGPLNAPFNPATQTSTVVTYAYPSQGSQPLTSPNGAIPVSQRDVSQNDQAIVKLQYQHNFGAAAYLRIYGYTYYSDWLEFGPNASYVCVNAACFIPTIFDYELSNHTRGVSATFGDQISDKHLLTVQGAVSNAYNYRMNNNTPLIGNFAPARFIYLVDSNNPNNGICYNKNSLNPFSCYNRGTSASLTGASTYRLSTAAAGGVPAAAGTCGTGPCEWLAVENGLTGGANLGKPQFISGSITDQWQATSKLLFNAGIRYDSYAFKGSDTNVAPGTPGSQGSARSFWFNAWNLGECVSPLPGDTPGAKTGDPNLPCPAGLVPATLINLPNHTNTFTVWQPRIGATYTINQDNVLRFNYGKYAEAPNAAFEQYNILDQNLPLYDGSHFWAFGFNTTSHSVGPEVSFNLDASWEHQFHGTSVGFKLTPFYRKTQNQIQNFYLNQQQNFVSGLNVGRLTASGVEFQFNAGDFFKNGWASQFTYTYTNSFFQYDILANGGTALTPINNSIENYNAFTSFCAANPNDARCGSGRFAGLGSPCYDSTGAATPCSTPGAISNPYWNAPVQALLDEKNGSFKPFSTQPGGLQSSSQSILTPNVATLIVNYKHDKWAITPSFQFFEGNYYGAPLMSSGIDPSSGCGALGSGGVSASDPRYPYGSPGGSPYDATTCPGTIPIPNPYTHSFDNLGAFLNPSQLLAHVQLSFEPTSNMSYRLTLANVINTCFGGTKMPWTVYADRRVCSFALPGWGNPLPYAANVYNPGAAFQPQVQFPYQQQFGTIPFQATLELTAKL